MAVMTVERPLREKLGDEGTNALVNLFDKFEENIKVDVIALSTDKYERRLTEEIANVRIDIAEIKVKLEGRLSEETGKIRVEMAELKSELKQEMAELKSELKQEMAELKSELKQDMAGLRAEFKEDMAGLRAELKEDMAGLRAELKESEERYERRLSEETGKLKIDMAKNYASLIKWMFIFWLGQIGAILGILFAFFKS